MSRQRVLATKPAVINYEKLWNEATAAWANALDLSDVDATHLGFDFDSPAPTAVQVQALVDAHDPSPPPPTATQLQIAADKAQVVAFFNAPSGSATPVQRDDTTKAIIRYLRRRGDDA